MSTTMSTTMNATMNAALDDPVAASVDARLSENAIAIEAWNTVLFDKFCRFRYVLTQGLADHSDELLWRNPFPAGARVLDIGCGFGDTTQLIARQIGPTGIATGIDCATNFIASARREARDAGVKNIDFLAADVQTDDLHGPYDKAFARFGTMFFNMPVAALRNIRKALKPGGELSMIVWRKREDNPWIHKAELAVRRIVPVISHEETDQVHCGPGPFSMAGADLVSDMLRIAGFERSRFERYDTDICIGRTLNDAVEFAMALGPAGEIIRLAGDVGQKLKPDVIAALRSTLAEHVRPDGVWIGSSSWFVTAYNPAPP
ncbi:MAG TPA: class I SAM-dependent methyltransferase [Xanthobacteraceae bacterium]|nr:class I SAM-dependent methyltransferase [Xanthobacteraceae bacterium]